MKRKRRLFRLGAVILSVGLLCGGVTLVNNVIHHQESDFVEDTVVKIEENKQESTVEVLLAPVNKEIGIVRYHYNHEDELAKKEQSLIIFEGVYRPHVGIDYAHHNTFDVYASLTGEVTEINNDPLLGKTITIKNKDEVEITYQSLSQINVKVKDQVKQGDIIGKSGTNQYEADLNNHIHFTLKKQGQYYNPEHYLNKPINTIK